MSFSNNERVLLINQFQILSLLYEIKGDKSTAEDYEVATEGVLSGLGDWAFENIGLPQPLEKEMDKDDQEYVIGVLNMYNTIYSAYENNLNEEERKNFDIKRIKFIGFDGNDERGLLYFCNYLIDRLKRFSFVGEFIEKQRWERNSHGFGDTELKEMYERYKKLDKSRNFGLKEVNQILGK